VTAATAPAAAPLAISRGQVRYSALAWALLHAPLILLLYAGSIRIAFGAIGTPYRTALVVLYAAEAVLAAAALYAFTLPLSFWPRFYRYAAPAVIALGMVAIFVDSRLYLSLNFHINAYFFQVVTQPGMTGEVGASAIELTALGAAWATWVGLSVWGGSRFLHRFRRGARVWPWLLAFAGLEVADRFTQAVLNFYGGPPVAAAGAVLPLQVRFGLPSQLSRISGRPLPAGALHQATRQSRYALPEGALPADVRFTRRPDVVFALIESTRADFLDAVTMPRLMARARDGALFDRHYAAATSTHYSVFSLFYSLQSHKMETVVGSGRAPLLFGALRHNGYQARYIAASSIEWMGIRGAVFSSVEDDLISGLPGSNGAARDASMLAAARRTVAGSDTTEPLFLFLFFDGTHFTYSFPEGAGVFQPSWNGRGNGAAARVSPERLRNRARNAAHEVDRKLDEFLRWMETRRGRAPLVIVTGDHGEEYREHGRVGHGTGVTVQQTHVPMVMWGPGVPRGTFSSVTTGVDIVPTLFRLLGDSLPYERYSDGMSMFESPADRFVLTSVGWEPEFAVIGRDLKASFATHRSALGTVLVTDPFDRPLPDAQTRFNSQSGNILRALAQR
jgi:uncharacterized protein